MPAAAASSGCIVGETGIACTTVTWLSVLHRRRKPGRVGNWTVPDVVTGSRSTARRLVGVVARRPEALPRTRNEVAANQRRRVAWPGTRRLQILDFITADHLMPRRRLRLHHMRVVSDAVTHIITTSCYRTDIDSTHRRRRTKQLIYLSLDEKNMCLLMNFCELLIHRNVTFLKNLQKFHNQHLVIGYLVRHSGKNELHELSDIS